MENILDYTICSGLELKYDNHKIAQLYKSIPNNVFGVFVSVKRYLKLKKWPEDIHGCIGYWSDDYKVLNKNVVIDKLKDVSYKATHLDDRKNYFKIPLVKDSLSEYEINFMKTPLYNINSATGILNNGIKFNNNIYGLIVVDEFGYRATYLPEVFKNISWDKIKKSLINKGSISGTPQFYAYKTLIKKKQIYKLLNNSYINYYFNDYLIFLNKYYGSFVPYSFMNNQIYIDKDQDVRNTATIYDFLLFDKTKKYYKSHLSTIKDNLMYYLQKFDHDSLNMRQASSFLLLSMQKLNIKKTKINEICNFLYNNIDILEPKFELGEVLIALTKVCPIKRILLKKQIDMYNSILERGITRDDIFEYNWHAKYLYSLYMTGFTKNSNNSFFSKHAHLLKNRIIELISGYNDNNETNYLAVAFEALCSLINLIKTNKNEVWNNIFYLFYLLQKRYNSLFYFKNNSARLYITGYILNGLYIL